MMTLPVNNMDTEGTTETVYMLVRCTCIKWVLINEILFKGATVCHGLDFCIKTASIKIKYLCQNKMLIEH